MKKIVVIGSSNTDMVIKVDKLPKAGETVLGNEFSMVPGGKGANQAVAASRAGGNVTFVARIGKDIFGDNSLTNLTRAGVNVDQVIRDDKTSSGIALIHVDNKGENIIAVSKGSNYKLSPADIENAKNTISAADIVLIQLEIPKETVMKIIDLASKNNVKVILNPAPVRQFDRRILKKVSLLTPNQHEAEALPGIKARTENDAKKVARKLLREVKEAVIITMGSRGAFVTTKDVQKLIPAFKEKTIDTTGAGDVFNGALAVALTEGKELREAVRFSNAAAALSTTKVGAQVSIPTRKEIEKLLG